MRKLLLALTILAGLSLPAQAQTNAEIAALALATRNAPICDAWALAYPCADIDALAAWCVANNKPSGAMCVASDTRAAAEKVIGAAEYKAEVDALAAARALVKARALRKNLMLLFEIAATDPTVRAKLCTDAGVQATDCK